MYRSLILIYKLGVEIHIFTSFQVVATSFEKRFITVHKFHIEVTSVGHSVHWCFSNFWPSLQGNASFWKNYLVVIKLLLFESNLAWRYTAKDHRKLCSQSRWFYVHYFANFLPSLQSLRQFHIMMCQQIRQQLIFYCNKKDYLLISLPL